MENIKSFILLLAACFAVALAADGDNSTCNKENCPWHLWNHYEAKGCTPVQKDGECCPVAFNCTSFEGRAQEESCQFKGKAYKQTEKIESTNPCHECRCGAKGLVLCEIKECYTETNLPNCIPLFEHSSCCPKNQYCLPLDKKSTEEITDVTTCKWEDRTYVEDQIIELRDHPCLTCICKKGFNGPKSPSCKKVECSFPGNNHKMTRKCIPVYMEHRCCSVDWICPPDTTGLRPNPEEPEEKPIEGGCTFGKRHFAVNSSLDIRDPCTTCTCTTPPDFTCIRQQCSGPPNGDFINCHPVASRPDQCCPQFRCIAPGDIPPGMFPAGGNPPPEGQRPPTGA